MTSHHTDVDEVVVRRLLSGERGLDPSVAELVAATAKLMAENKTNREIADRLGRTKRSVERYRKDVRTGRFGALGGLALLAKGGFPGHLSVPVVVLLVIAGVCLLAAALLVLFGRR